MAAGHVKRRRRREEDLDPMSPQTGRINHKLA
jgi:hypothetical protein